MNGFVIKRSSINLQGRYLQETNVERNLSSQVIIRQISDSTKQGVMPTKHLENSLTSFICYRYLQNLESSTVANILRNGTSQTIVPNITAQNNE